MITDQDFLNWLENQPKTIKIKCRGSGVLKLDEFQVIQGNLKSIKDNNLIKLIKSILTLGFIAPIFIWNKEILDGTHRLKALYFLEGKGFKIPEIPTVNVIAQNKTEAKKELLAISSHYADFEMEEVSEWVMQIGDGVDEIIRIQEYVITDESETKESNEEKEAIPKSGLPTNCVIIGRLKENIEAGILGEVVSKIEDKFNSLGSFFVWVNNNL